MSGRNNVWSYNEGGTVLELTGEQAHRDYFVDLARCKNASEAWDWVSHVAMKTWATDQIVADLVRRIAEHVHQHRNFQPPRPAAAGPFNRPRIAAR